MRLFQEASATQAIREANVTDDRAWRFVLSRPAAELRFRDVQRVGGTLEWTTEWSASRDTVLLWPSDTTALADGRYEIATEEAVLDTLRYRALRPMPFNVALRLLRIEDIATPLVHFEATRPLAAIDPERISLRWDSTDHPFRMDLDPMNTRYAIGTTDLPPGASATLTLLPKALRDRYGGWNDTLRIALGRAADQAMGTLRVTVRTDETLPGDLVLELLDAQGRVVRTSRVEAPGKAVVWERISPGNHTLRLTGDTDRNGHWDTGSWGEKRQPERVWHYADAVNVRAAWDLGIDWSLSGP